MRLSPLVVAAIAGFTSIVLAGQVAAQSRSGPATFVSGTLIGANGLPYRPSVGSTPYLPFGGTVSRLPSGRAVFVPQSTVTYVHVPGAAPPWPASNIASAPPAIIRLGEPGGYRRPAARVVVVNGSSPALRPEVGPKIIRIER